MMGTSPLHILVGWMVAPRVIHDENLAAYYHVLDVAPRSIYDANLAFVYSHGFNGRAPYYP